MSVKIYSTTTCTYCQITKDYLKEKGVEFEEINITEDIGAMEMIREKTGMLTVPVIEIDNEFIVGFNKQKIDEILKI